jgi:hypothetical protein
MPLYKVNFTDNSPSSAAEVADENFSTLKEFDVVNEQMYIKWYIVQADNQDHALDLAGRLVYQIWGDALFKPLPPLRDTAE